jgi:hypothetical protein
VSQSVPLDVLYWVLVHLGVVCYPVMYHNLGDPGDVVVAHMLHSHLLGHVHLDGNLSVRRLCCFGSRMCLGRLHSIRLFRGNYCRDNYHHYHPCGDTLHVVAEAVLVLPG